MSDYPYYYGMTPTKVSPGLATTFAISRTFISQYNAGPTYQYSECTVREDGSLMKPLADTTLYDLTIATNFRYTRDLCVQMCYQHGLIQECNCVDYNTGTQPSGNTSYCLPPSVQTCEAQYRADKFVGLAWVGPNCLEKCPIECSRASMPLTISSFVFPPSQLYANHTLGANSVLSSLRANQSDYINNKEKNLIRLVFYLDSLSYQQVEEEAKLTIDNLIGTIGGHLHLFLGMSFLSFVEIALLVVKYALVSIGVKMTNPKRFKGHNNEVCVTPQTNPASKSISIIQTT